MPADVMTLAEFKTDSSHWSQKRSSHTNLIQIDQALTLYHNIAKEELEQRIVSLKTLRDTAKDYADDKRLFVWQTTRRKQKIKAADSVYNQAVLKIKYLEEVLIAEQRLPAMFGVGLQTPMQSAPSPRAKWAAALKQLQGMQEYIGKPKAKARMLDAKYWTEAIDPLHRHWKNPQNAPIFEAWSTARYQNKTTQLSFYRWLEQQSDEQIDALSSKGLLSTNYQDSVGREQYRVYMQDGRLKYLKGPDTMANWSTEKYSTNFCGSGWAIFVLSMDNKLYANSHISSEGWFHAAFLGGKPVKAAGELYVRDGKPLIITDKSGHYKPQFKNLVEAAFQMNKARVDISELRIWSRYVNPLTQKSFTGNDGMRANAIWYMSIDARRYLVNNNIPATMIHDFSIAHKGIWTANVMTNPQQPNWLPLKDVVNKGKGHFISHSLDTYCKLPHML